MARITDISDIMENVANLIHIEKNSSRRRVNVTVVSDTEISLKFYGVSENEQIVYHTGTKTFTTTTTGELPTSQFAARCIITDLTITDVLRQFKSLTVSNNKTSDMVVITDANDLLTPFECFISDIYADYTFKFETELINGGK